MRPMVLPYATRAPTLIGKAPIELLPLSLKESICAALIAAPVAAVPLLRPSSRRWLELLACSLRWMLVFLILQFARRLQKQGSQLVSEKQAAVEGSRFTEVAPGIELHHLLVPPRKPARGSAPLLLHFNHGFGANSFTWDPLFDSLGGALETPAQQRPPPPQQPQEEQQLEPPPLPPQVWLSAHDRLGFGLSSRPRDVRSYSEEAGAAYALKMIRTLTPDLMSSSLPLTATDGASSAAPSHRPFVLVGHSLGGCLSARMALECLEDVDALVLIAPALIAPPAAGKTERVEPTPADGPPPSPRADGALLGASRRLGRAASELGLAACRPIGAALGTLCLPLRACLSRASRLALQLAVRCVLFSAAFWTRGLRLAYNDHSKLTAEMCARYRWPARVAGADRGVACFTLCQLRAAFDEVLGRLGLRSRTSAARRSDVEVVAQLRKSHVPILILHGTNDLVVPAFNSRRLVRSLGEGAHLVELPACGHCPHEEAPDVVAEAIVDFLRKQGVLASSSRRE